MITWQAGMIYMIQGIHVSFSRTRDVRRTRSLTGYALKNAQVMLHK